MIQFWFRYKPIMLIHWIFSTWLGSFSLFLLLPFVLAISVHMQPNLTLFPYLLLSSSPPQIRTICPWTKGILKCSTTEHGSFVQLVLYARQSVFQPLGGFDHSGFWAQNWYCMGSFLWRWYWKGMGRMNF